jgi:hypothetical protein
MGYPQRGEIMLRIPDNLKSLFGRDRESAKRDRRIDIRHLPDVEYLEERTLLSVVENFAINFQFTGSNNRLGVANSSVGFDTNKGIFTLNTVIPTFDPANPNLTLPIIVRIGPGDIIIQNQYENVISFQSMQPLANSPSTVNVLENPMVTEAIRQGSPGFIVTYVGGSAVSIPHNPGQYSHITLSYSFDPLVNLVDFKWNTDANGKAANADHRGIDFTYNVKGGISSSTPIPLTFWWASGTEPADIISPAYSDGSSTPDAMNINTTAGTHGFGSDDPSFQDGNDSARWGTPPAKATHILAILSPRTMFNVKDFWYPYVITSFDPKIYDGQVGHLKLPTSVSEVLKGTSVNGTFVNAVSHKIKTMTFNGVNGPTMTAMFSPTNEDGSLMPLSEAEVYLGIDHFNWIQNVVHTPPTWQIVTLVNPDVSVLLSNNGLSKPQDSLTLINGHIYYKNGANVIDYAKGTVQYYSVGPNFLDPIAEGSSTSGLSEQYVRAFIIGNVFQALIVPADKYYYYYNETNSTNPLDGGVYNLTFGTAMLFLDMPFIQNELNAYANSEYMGVVTRLVGGVTDD